METKNLTMFNQTIQYENDCIWVKPVCELFNLDVQNQYKKIKNDVILGKLSVKNMTDFGKIDKNGKILLTKKGFLRWIQIINVNTIEESLREKFISYQTLIFDFLYGNIQSDEQAKLDYKRLKKCRSLYAKIGREIQRLDKSFTNYLENKFVQTSLELKEHDQE